MDCVLYRYEWVDVGMLDYDPDSKLYHVKRVYVPTHILESSTTAVKKGDGEIGDGGDGGDGGEGAGRVSDGEQEAEQPQETARADGVEKKQVMHSYV